MSAAPVQAVTAALHPPLSVAPPAAAPPQPGSFMNVLMNGVDQANRQVLQAQSQATAFALDDSVPLHQVTYALEHARLSMELVLQVRSKLVEGFQELMRMQL